MSIYIEEKKINYKFIDAIRCIAMLFIVAEHCFAWGRNDYQYSTSQYWTFLAAVQLSKFGTITFFLLAGFLLGENFENYRPLEYLKRRLANTIVPWLFWSLLFLFIDILGFYMTRPIGHSRLFTWEHIYRDFIGLYKLSNYWFVINFMASLSVLLLFRRYIYSMYFGIILAIFTSFYCINIYYSWIFPNHTTAILGFVFFIWIGVQVRKHWSFAKMTVDSTPVYIVISWVVFFYLLAIYESSMLENITIDKTNTLRISNIFYSLSCFYLLLKINNFSFFMRLKPRQTTYGIYLIHFILVAHLIPLLSSNVKMYITPVQFVAYRLLWFAIVYSLTFLIVAVLNKTKAKKLIGN